MSEASSRDAHIRALGALLVLEDTLRRGDRIETIAGALVNDLPLVMRCDMAVAWRAGPRSGKLLAVHGLPEPARDAPFTLWSTRVCAHLAAGASEAARTVSPADLPASLRRDWGDFMPSDVVWVPLTVPGENAAGGNGLGGMLAARSTPWREEDLRLLTRLGQAAAHAMDRLIRRRPALRRRGRAKPLALLALAAAIAALFLPVPLSVLAPGEIRPAKEHVVRAALQGVVGEVLVEPNQTVAAGDLLLRFDDVAIRTRLAKAEQDLAVAEAEYRQAQQTAMRDAEASSRRAGLAARVGQAQAEVRYVRDLLDRVEVRAEYGGVAIVPDPKALPGRPVQLGERLMSVADPSALEVEAWMPVDDAVPLPDNAPVRLYLNVAPDRSLRGTVRQIDYRAREGPNGAFGFRVVADLQTRGTAPRIGLRGTARLEAGEVPLAVFLFRRPWAALRPWLGL